MDSSLTEALVRSAFLSLDGAMDGHDQLVVPCLVPSIEELADGLLEQHDDMTATEALEVGSEIRATVLEALEWAFTTRGGDHERS